MKKTLTVFLAAAALFAAGCSSTPEYKSVSTTYTAAAPAETIHEKITNAAQARRWKVVQDTPGKLLLEYKGQQAEVVYGAGQVTITQVGGDSDVLGWLNRLKTSLDQALPKS